MSARDVAAAVAAAVAAESRLSKLRRLAAQSACLPSMLSSIEFIHPERQEAMLIECQNFADDVSKELSEIMRAEVSND